MCHKHVGTVLLERHRRHLTSRPHQRAGLQGRDADIGVEGSDSAMAQRQQARTKLARQDQRICARSGGASACHRLGKAVGFCLWARLGGAAPLHQQGGGAAGLCRGALAARHTDRWQQAVPHGAKEPKPQLWLTDPGHQRAPRATGATRPARVLDTAVRPQLAAPKGTCGLRHDDRRLMAGGVHLPRV